MRDELTHQYSALEDILDSGDIVNLQSRLIFVVDKRAVEHLTEMMSTEEYARCAGMNRGLLSATVL